MSSDMLSADTPEMSAPDYRETVFLPETAFPMRAGLPQREPDWLARWEAIGIYDRLREKVGRTSFTLHDGPPYANAHLHIGHALNKTIKDMIVRSHQMMGFDARYVPGWDCHGLPIEWKIEEQYRAKGLNKDDVDIVAFRQECRKFAEHWVGVQREEFKRLGITGNWADPYLTMDYHAEAVIAGEFMKFLMNGSLYQGSKPVMWSPVEKTALAEAEVEYHDKESFTVWVKFRVVAAQHADLNGAYVVIWTTTPWTMPSNKAVVWGKDISYGLYEITGRPEESWVRIGDRYILSDKLAASVLQRARLDDTMYRRLRDVDATMITGLRHPLFGADGANGEWDDIRDFRPAEFVTDDEGTGFVHCAPSHGMEEFELYRDLGMLGQVITYNVMEDGRFRDDMPFFGGAAILRDAPNKKNKDNPWEGDANSMVIAKLAEVGGLLARGKIKHSYPHSWRSKAPVIYRNTPQWFVAIDRTLDDGMGTYGDTIRQRALTSIDQLVHWTPQTGRNRLHSMIEARPDWVLSRQRAWGVPMTCFIKTGAKPDAPEFLLRSDEVNARIVAAFEAEGADVWYMPGFKEKVLAGIVDPAAYTQIFDVLDVWFDSGSTHAFVLRDRPDGTPDGIADVYMEGTDQHRGWFHSSLLQACGTMGRAPYRNVVTHGFTLDEKGMKMSKSLGNTTAPQEVIGEYGADILRLWVAQSDYTLDQRIGKEILKGTADSYRRLRNTMRFLLGNLAGFTEAEKVEPADMPELERWVLHRLADLDAEVRSGYARFDFQDVLTRLFSFATTDLSSLYFDIRKDSLYCDATTSLTRRACRTVLDIVFHRLTTWLAPILVFTMEEVWLERFPGEGSSVHLVDMPPTPSSWRDDALAAKWDTIRTARRVVTGALEVQRSAKVIGASLEAAPSVFVTPAMMALLESVPFEEVCITSCIWLSTKPAPDAAFRLDDVPEIAVQFDAAPGHKCERCWKVLPDVGSHSHAATCARCNDALG